MRFFFLAKEKKNVSLNTTSSSRFLFCSLSVSLSLSLSAQTVKVIFEGRRETAFLPLFFCSRRLARGCVVVYLCSFSFLLLSLCVSFKRK